MGANRTTDWETATRVGKLETTLSFAVLLVDSVTDRQPSGDVTVSLADSPATAVENRSGFHLFLDLDADPVTLTVDGGDRYFDERRTIYHSESPPDESSSDEPPVEEVTDASYPVVVSLTPTPAYQFASGTTRIRGTVTDGPADDDGTVSEATISLEGFTPTARTTDSGEYALYVPARAGDVVRTNGTQMVKVKAENGGNGPPGNGDERLDPELTVRHSAHPPLSKRIPIEAGVLTELDVDMRRRSVRFDVFETRVGRDDAETHDVDFSSEDEAVIDVSLRDAGATEIELIGPDGAIVDERIEGPGSETFVAEIEREGEDPYRLRIETEATEADVTVGVVR